MLMGKYKKLSPLPWEAVEAQHDWLMEQFDKGLNYAKQMSHVSDDELRPPVPQVGGRPILNDFRPTRFQRRAIQFALEPDNFLADIRSGLISPIEAVTFKTVTVTIDFNPQLATYLFRAIHEDKIHSVSVDAVAANNLTENEILKKVVKELKDMIRRASNE